MERPVSFLNILDCAAWRIFRQRMSSGGFRSKDQINFSPSIRAWQPLHPSSWFWKKLRKQPRLLQIKSHCPETRPPPDRCAELFPNGRGLGIFSPAMSIPEHRKAIDKLDGHIIRLLNERTRR